MVKPPKDEMRGGNPFGCGTCPDWCVRRHGAVRGEDDWLHIGSPVAVGGALMVRLCMSVDPGTGAVDGPFVLLGSDELSVGHARALGKALVGLADAASADIRRADAASTAVPSEHLRLPQQGSGHETASLVRLHPSYGDESGDAAPQSPLLAPQQSEGSLPVLDPQLPQH